MADFLQELSWLYALLICAGAWIAFAEHPTARNARQAIIATMGL